jgi:hypothetical protein
MRKKGKDMIQVKFIGGTNVEDNINDFLSYLKKEQLIDIKYEISSKYGRTAMIIYNTEITNGN